MPGLYQKPESEVRYPNGAQIDRALRRSPVVAEDVFVAVFRRG
jgi:hypothetical protein